MFGDLVVNLVARVNQFTGPMRAARGVLSGFGNHASAAVSRVVSVFQSLTGVGGIVSAAFGGLTLGVALKSFADAGSELADLSARTGASVESLSLLKFAAEQTGADMDVVEGGIKKLDNVMADAIAGNEAAAKSFKTIGLDARTLLDMPLNERLIAIASGLDKIENPSLRGAAAVDLLGKSGRELIPMLKELEPLQSRASELGLGWTTEDAALADAVGDRMDEIQAVFGRIVGIVIAELAPAFLSLTDSIDTWIPAVKSGFTWLIEAAGEWWRMLSFVFANFGPLASLTLSQVGLYFVTLGNDIAHFFTGTLPAALMGFVKYATTLMSTLLENITGQMADVKAMLSGGEATHTWKALGDVQFTMNAPQRQKTDLEKSLDKSIADKQERLGAAWNAGQKPPVPSKEGPLFHENSQGEAGVRAADEAAAKTRRKEIAAEMKPLKSSDALQAGSKEAYSAILASMLRTAGPSPQDKQLAVMKDQAKQTQRAADETAKLRHDVKNNKVAVVENLDP